MEPCCGDPPGRCRTDTRLLVAVAPGARMRALQWRAGTTLRVWTPPLPGPRGTRWSPYFLFFINFLILPQNLFQTCTDLKPPMSLPLRENSSQKTCPLLTVFMLTTPRPTFLAEVFSSVPLGCPRGTEFSVSESNPSLLSDLLPQPSVSEWKTLHHPLRCQTRNPSLSFSSHVFQV